jgi:hypothetical protein
MSLSMTGAWLSSCPFIGMIGCLELGFRIGRSAALSHEPAHAGLGPIEAAIFALMGLLLGFAFAGGMSRMDARRQLIVREANAIGTAYLRLDLLPASEQPVVRRLFRGYLKARSQAYQTGTPLEATDRFIAQAAELQQQIWTRTIAVARDDPTQNVTRVVVPALNEMIDVTTARTVALRTRLPFAILALLLGVALSSALLAGYGMASRKRRSWFHTILYAASVAVTVYIVLDLDDPRVGLIRLDAAEAILRQLQDSIRP